MCIRDRAIFVPVLAVLALLFALMKVMSIRKQPVGNASTKQLGDAIYKGAMAFLNQEYKILVFVVAALAVVLSVFISWKLAVAFVIGALFSALAGNIGMRIATSANTRTATASKKGLNAGLKVAFASGTVMGMTVTGLGLLGVAVLYYIFGDPKILYGFGFGASTIALFARVGGGIYTKAADVGADLVGKIEAGIPEDDPRNPAVIADNVGDNVGDVAGMGADLFESYVDSIIVAMVLGIGLFALGKGVVAPMLISAAGILSSIIGTFFVRTGKNTKPHTALNRGIFVSAGIMVVLSFFIIRAFLGDMGVFYSAVSGLVAGIVIGLITEYYTSEKNKPAQAIAKAAETGAATNIIEGLALGMKSTLVPVVAVCAAILLSYHFGGLYGIAIAAVGMLSTLGITLASIDPLLSLIHI